MWPIDQVGMVGDAQVGKTTLMVKYVENKFDEEYIMTLGEIALASWPCREQYHCYRVYPPRGKTYLLSLGTLAARCS